MSCTNKRHILEIEDLSISFWQYENDASSRQIETVSYTHLDVYKRQM